MNEINLELPSVLNIELDFLLQDSTFTTKEDLIADILFSVTRSRLVKEKNYRKKSGEIIYENSGINLRIASLSIKRNLLRKGKNYQDN